MAEKEIQESELASLVHKLRDAAAGKLEVHLHVHFPEEPIHVVTHRGDGDGEGESEQNLALTMTALVVLIRLVFRDDPELIEQSPILKEITDAVPKS